jgi:hypothetical protein
VTTTREPPAASAHAPEARVVYRAPPGRRGAGGRSRLAPALGALVALLVVFALGAAFGRSTAGHPSAATPARGAGPAAAPQAQPGGTGTGAAQPQVPAIPGAGPTRTVDGVPVGYTRSKAGAVAAATNYTAVLSSPVVFDEGRRKRAVAALADPAIAADLQASTAKTSALLAGALRLPAGSGGSGALLRAIPVAYRVDRYDENAATVSIWQTSLGGSTTGAPIQQSWGITTVDLRWVAGDWKQRKAVTTLGPVPLADDALPTAASQLIDQTKDFEEYRYGPGN